MKFSFQKNDSHTSLRVKGMDAFDILSCVAEMIKKVIESSKLPEDAVLYCAALGAACVGRDDIPKNVDDKICDLLDCAKEIAIDKKCKPRVWRKEE